MLVAERKAKIMEAIEVNGSVLVEDLANQLGVSPMTIRRDLIKLKEEGIIERCHGGAVLKQEVSYGDKRTSHRKEKKELAIKGAQFVNPGDTVFLDAGTTTYEIAKKIRDIPEITVVTIDLEIAQLLKKSEVCLILCGGVVQKSTGGIFGYHTTQMLSEFRFDIGFFGAASINAEFQVLTPTIDKAFLKRETTKLCEQSYLVVDDSKFYKQAMTKINHLGEYTGVITNREFNENEKEKLKQLGAKII